VLRNKIAPCFPAVADVGVRHRLAIESMQHAREATAIFVFLPAPTGARRIASHLGLSYCLHVPPRECRAIADRRYRKLSVRSPYHPEGNTGCRAGSRRTFVRFHCQKSRHIGWHRPDPPQKYLRQAADFIPTGTILDNFQGNYRRAWLGPDPVV